MYSTSKNQTYSAYLPHTYLTNTSKILVVLINYLKSYEDWLDGFQSNYSSLVNAYLFY